MTEHRSREGSASQSFIRPGNGNERTLSERVIDELAAAQNVAPIEIDQPLNDSIDPDALDALFAPLHDGTPRNSEGYVEFSSNGYHIVVRTDGEIRLESPTDSPV